MKKILSIIIVLFIVLQPFCFAQTDYQNTSSLYKQGQNYLSQKNYPKAFDSFSSIYKYAKTQQDYGYIMYGFLELIKNNEIPVDLRVDLCRMILSDDFNSKITDKKLSNLSFAIRYKMINILAKADSNDKVFTEILKSDKQTVLNDYRKIYASELNNTNDPAENAIARLYYALYEYAVGNWKLALGQIENEGNNILKYGNKSENEDCTEIVNLVFELCK